VSTGDKKKYGFQQDIQPRLSVLLMRGSCASKTASDLFVLINYHTLIPR
jgi:hypothetical protein